MNEQLLLEQIAKEPGDDVVRLMYADALEERGDDRAELIRLQIELAGESIEDLDLGQRARELEFASRKTLLQQLRPLGVRDIRFQRGFPEKVLVEGLKFLERPRTFFKHLPLIRAFMWRAIPAGEATRALRQLVELNRLSALEALDLSGCNVGGGGIQALKSADFWSTLRKLRLGHNHLNGDGMAELSSGVGTQLESLDLSGNDLAMPDMRLLVRSKLCESLQQLQLARNRLGDDAVLKLVAAPSLRKLQWLDLAHNQFGVEGVLRLTESASLSQLQGLDVSGNPIRADGIRKLTTASIASQLEHLGVADCELEDDGVAAIADSQFLKQLTSLNLGRNGLGEVVEQLVRLPSPNLQSLDLSHNRVPVRAVLRLLKQAGWKELNELRLAHNGIRDADLSRLVSSAEIRQLRRVDLSSNRITEEGLEILVQAAANARWQTVDLRKNSGALQHVHLPVTTTRFLLEA